MRDAGSRLIFQEEPVRPKAHAGTEFGIRSCLFKRGRLHYSAFRIPYSACLSLLLAVCVQAAPWSGVLDPSRAIDWSQAGVPGGIPNRTTVCATLNPGATAAQINSAIAACPANQVVFLNAGTYNLSTGLFFNNKSNVTVRGAGADQTILKFTGAQSCNGAGGDVC